LSLVKMTSVLSSMPASFTAWSTVPTPRSSDLIIAA